MLYTLLYSLLAITFSTLAVLWLRRGDIKRARVLNKPIPVNRTKTIVVTGWLAVLLPVAPLILIGNLVALVVWFGAMTVVGWILAANRPSRSA